jgi:hypothetical protein
MSPTRWHLLISFVLVIPVLAWAQAYLPETMKQADATQSFRQGRLLDTFGKWEIREGLSDYTYLLIGESANDGESHFWVHCDRNNLITVAVPLMQRPGSDHLRAHSITIRSDTGLSRAMSFVVFENVVALAIDYAGGRNDKVANFLDVLNASKEMVTISYANRSFDYNVAQLPAAQIRFQELCHRTVHEPKSSRP